jgi:hypothetical protein
MNAKQISITGLALLAALTLAGAAEATVNGRQVRQHGRIANGWQSGALTRNEAVRISTQQRHIRREEAFYRATGPGLGPLERLDLRRDQNRASCAIWRQKHDRQSRN